MAAPPGSSDAATAEGNSRLAEEVLAALTERLASWTEKDLQTFARMIERFNAGDWSAS